MEVIPGIIFDGILRYATENKTMLKQTATWERVSKQFATRLLIEFWKNIRQIAVRFFAPYFEPFLMRIEYDNYETIDLNALTGFKKRGIRGASIMFSEKTPADFVLPLGFAASVPSTFSIHLGNYQNLNDPQLLNLLQENSIKIFHFFITNPTINDAFINALLNLNSLNQLRLVSLTLPGTLSAEFRRTLITQLNKLYVKCLVLVSSSDPGYPGYGGIFDEELFTLLENQYVKCLHLKSLNHYVDRWLANSLLHKRARITHLCITNDHFGYNFGEVENESAPLFHTLTDYCLLFPKLQFLCIGIALLRFDNDQLDSVLLYYFLTSENNNIKMRLTIRVFHDLEEVPNSRFDSVFGKLKTLHATVVINRESKTHANILITSKTGNIVSDIIICFSTVPIYKPPLQLSPYNNKCVDWDHLFPNSIHCLCACNQ